MKKILILILTITITTQSYSQGDLNIFQLYDLAIKNHPLSNLDSLYNIQEEYNISTINKKYLPEMNLSGQLSYQSVSVNWDSSSSLLVAVPITATAFRLQTQSLGKPENNI